MPFIKRNATNDPHALRTEAASLKALSKQIEQLDLNLKTPEILSVDDQQLCLEHIDSQTAQSTQWQILGDQLAALHQAEQKTFGYCHDNYIGLNPQKNDMSNHWGTFFYQQRLMFQCQLIQDPGVYNEIKNSLLTLEKNLTNWLAEECTSPALLHGDLWSGNVLFSQHNVWLIDPAIYWGDPEADIAMTELFGGFPKSFYRSYHERLPRSPNYPLKKICYNLYHYLNHYNLFGGGYLAACRSHLNHLTTALT